MNILYFVHLMNRIFEKNNIFAFVNGGYSI